MDGAVFGGAGARSHGSRSELRADVGGAAPDRVVAWNPIMKREVHVFHHVPEERIHVGGVAHWDIYFNGSFQAGAARTSCARGASRRPVENYTHIQRLLKTAASKNALMDASPSLVPGTGRASRGSL